MQAYMHALLDMITDDGGSSALQSPKQHGSAEARPTEASALAAKTGAGAGRIGTGSSPVRPRHATGSKIPSERVPVAAGSEAQFGGKVR